MQTTQVIARDRPGFAELPLPSYNGPLAAWIELQQNPNPNVPMPSPRCPFSHFRRNSISQRTGFLQNFNGTLQDETDMLYQIWLAMTPEQRAPWTRLTEMDSVIIALMFPESAERVRFEQAIQANAEHPMFRVNPAMPAVPPVLTGHATLSAVPPVLTGPAVPGRAARPSVPSLPVVPAVPAIPGTFVTSSRPRVQQPVTLTRQVFPSPPARSVPGPHYCPYHAAFVHYGAGDGFQLAEIPGAPVGYAGPTPIQSYEVRYAQQVNNAVPVPYQAPFPDARYATQAPFRDLQHAGYAIPGPFQAYYEPYPAAQRLPENRMIPVQPQFAEVGPALPQVGNHGVQPEEEEESDEESDTTETSMHSPDEPAEPQVAFLDAQRERYATPQRSTLRTRRN